MEVDTSVLHELNSNRTRNYRRLNKEFDNQLQSFQDRHGNDQAELVLILVWGLRHVPHDRRLEISFDIVDSLLNSAAAQDASARASRAAILRHVENHAMKADVFDWLDINRANFKSMDAAAEAIAGKICPVSFRTARAWVAAWKKQRSAGKA
jgi:hypothetical protein